MLQLQLHFGLRESRHATATAAAAAVAPGQRLLLLLLLFWLLHLA